MFYEVFGPVIQRNSKYFVDQPAPPLGNDSTTKEEVDSFYNFWYRTACWREFGFV